MKRRNIEDALKLICDSKAADLTCVDYLHLIGADNCTLRSRNCEDASKLFFDSQRANLTCVNYLHLIDSAVGKEAGTDMQASCVDSNWSSYGQEEEKHLSYCQNSAYKLYKTQSLLRIKDANHREIPNLVLKLLRVSNIFHKTQNSLEASGLYCDIVRCLFERQCYDSFLFLNMWNSLCRKRNPLDAVISDKRHMSSLVLEYFLTVVQLVRENFRESCQFINYTILDELSFCPVTLALLSGDVDQLTVLLKFGFSQNSKRISSYDMFFASPFNDGYPWLRSSLKRIDSRKATITEILLFLICFSFHKSPAKRTSLLDCFLKLWRASTTPVVTPSELEKDVLLRLRNLPQCQPCSFFPWTSKQFYKLVVWYKCIYPFLPGAPQDPIQPRLLQHLCKSAIRQALLVNWNLPDGVHVLPLPALMKSYINS